MRGVVDVVEMGDGRASQRKPFDSGTGAAIVL